MNANERERIAVELCRMWPSKFTDPELTDFTERVASFRVTDVLQALNDHKNTQKFRPAISEILARLKGKKQENRDASGCVVDDFPTVLRKSNERWMDVKDNREVVLRYWRSCWFRYALDAERRKPDGNSAKGNAERYERQWNAMRHKCEVGCVNSLSVEGMAPKQAEAFASAIFQPPEEFRLTLMDLRGEIRDPFETAA